MAAPLFNPLTLLYGLSYLGPGLLLQIALGSTATAILAGAVVGRGTIDPNPPDEARPAAGAPRLAAASVQALRAASGSLWIDLTVGLVGAGLVAATVSPSWLAEGTSSGDPRAVPLLAAIAPGSYVSPETGMTMLPEMLKFRQSAGAMFVLMVLGVGMTIGHLSWIGRSFGGPVAARWLAAAVLLGGFGAVLIDRAHSPVGVVNPDNDHFEAWPIPWRRGAASSSWRPFVRRGMGRPVCIG